MTTSTADSPPQDRPTGTHPFNLVGVIDDDPWAAHTWSGISRYLFGAFRDRGVLHHALSAEPARLTTLAYKLLSVQPTMDRWRFRYHLHLGLYRRMTATAAGRLAELDAAAYDAVLQIGAWYDLPSVTEKPVASYHDGNLATLLASPYGYPPIGEIESGRGQA